MAKYKWHKHKTLSLYRALQSKPGDLFLDLPDLSGQYIRASGTDITMPEGYVWNIGTAVA